MAYIDPITQQSKVGELNPQTGKSYTTQSTTQSTIQPITPPITSYSGVLNSNAAQADISQAKNIVDTGTSALTSQQEKIKTIQDQITAAKKQVEQARSLGYQEGEQILTDTKGNILPKQTNISSLLGENNEYNAYKTDSAKYGRTPLSQTEWETQGKPTAMPKTALELENDKIIQMQKDTQAKLDQALNGTLPLSADQQAQITSLSQAYDKMIEEQKVANKNYEGAMEQAGISSGRQRYAPTIHAGNVKASIDAGINKIDSLNNEKAGALAKMREGFRTNNIEMIKASYDSWMSSEKEITANITKMSDKIEEEQKAAAAAKLQSDKDLAISELVVQGITSPAEILSTLKGDGLTITSKEVSDTLKNISLDTAQIQALAKTIAEKGAPQSVISKVLQSLDYSTALANSSGWISKLSPTEQLDFQLKQADLSYKIKQTQLLGEPTVTEKKKEADLLKSKEGQNQVLKDKVDLIDTILKGGIGEDIRVGPNGLTRGQTTWTGGLGRLASIVGIPGLIKTRTGELSGAGQAFAGAIHKLASKEFIDTLINSKQQGATYGSLTEREGEAIRNAATALNDWELKDSSGNPLGVWNVSQAEFDKELRTIRDNAIRVINQNNTLSVDEQSTLDSIFNNQNQDISNYYSE